MSSSAPPSISAANSTIKNPRKSMGFFANAVKHKNSFIQLFAMTGIFLLSIRSLGQKYRMHNLEDDTDALKKEQQGLESRMNHIKQSLLAEAEAESSGAFAARLRVLFGDEKADTALYALGIGVCVKDAVDDQELKYVYHPDGQRYIEVLPTFADLFATGVASLMESIPGLEFDPMLLLHGQQYIEIYKPLPSHGSIINKPTISGLHDKGKAAILEIEILSYLKETGEVLCMNRSACYLRGAGGFSKSSQPYSYSTYSLTKTAISKIPKHQPFAIYEECTLPAQALIYRLSGDYNPLHSDPQFAEVAGFSRPILHGLCTLGFAVRAINKCICRGEQIIIKNISARFLLHVYPGEILLTEMWLEGLRVLYQVKVKDRNKTVLSGYVELSRLSSSL